MLLCVLMIPSFSLLHPTRFPLCLDLLLTLESFHFESATRHRNHQCRDDGNKESKTKRGHRGRDDGGVVSSMIPFSFCLLLFLRLAL